MRALALALVIGFASLAIAQVDEISRRVTRISGELHSPYCPGKTLLSCTSSQAATLRQEMRAMMQEGLTDKQVLARLQERFGPSVVNPPQPWVTLIVPFLPFVVGFLVVAWAVRRWLRKGSDEPQG